MSLLQDPGTTSEAHQDQPSDRSGAPSAPEQRVDIDRTDDHRRRPDARPDERPLHGPVHVEPGGHITWRGMRIRRVRLASVAKLSLVFWLLAFAVLLGTVVVVWNAARAFGFITDLEEVVTTSLGLDEEFTVDGQALFRVTAAVVAFLSTLGWLMTLLLAAVYNASCAVLGGLAVDTGPLQRRRRVFSLRHRGFVTIRS